MTLNEGWKEAMKTFELQRKRDLHDYDPNLATGNPMYPLVR
jgi:hypothetical protein